MGSRDFTDGMWIWPEGLAHYVHNHGVTLPDDFVARVLSGSPTRYAREAEEVDWNYWHDWCGTRRATGALDRLRAARSEAEARVLILRQEALAAMIKSEGLSEEKCHWRTCNNEALKGARICAEHKMAVGTAGQFSGPLNDGLRQYLEECSKRIGAA
jgi:hypothetical protein